MPKTILCPVCAQRCIIDCGKCFTIPVHLGDGYYCPDPDEGFYGEDEGPTICCQYCRHEIILTNLRNSDCYMYKKDVYRLNRQT